jgi:hypothetical protein
MKIFITFLLIAQFTASFAQSIVFVDPVTSIGGPANDEYDLTFTFKNNTNQPITVKAIRYVINEVANTTNNFCLGVWCYNPEVSESPSGQGIIIGAGETNNTFKVSYQPNGNTGESVFEYCLYNDNDFTDSTCLRLSFNATPLGVEGIVEHNNQVVVYPNPANDFIFVRHFSDNGQNRSIKIINAFGKTIKEVPFSADSGEFKIDLSDLSAGFYYYSVISGQEIFPAQKLIIQ